MSKCLNLKDRVRYLTIPELLQLQLKLAMIKIGIYGKSFQIQVMRSLGSRTFYKKWNKMENKLFFLDISHQQDASKLGEVDSKP